MKKNEADLPKAFLIAIFVFIILIAEQYHLPPIFVVIFLLLLVLFIKIFSKPLEELLDNYEKKSKEEEVLNDYDGTIKKYLPEIKGEKFLLDVLYTRFVLVESALNKGDFDTIKELCTDSLYDILYSKWKNYSTKKEKRTREKMKVHSYNIQKLSLENNMISIKMYLHVSYYDYVIDADGKIIKGNKQTRKHQQFILEFVIDKDKSIKCPNCGAHISSKTCEYCNTTMKDVYYDFCLTKIGLANNRQVIDIDLQK